MKLPNLKLMLVGCLILGFAVVALDSYMASGSWHTVKMMANTAALCVAAFAFGRVFDE